MELCSYLCYISNRGPWSISVNQLSVISYVTVHFHCGIDNRALQWSGNPYGNGYGLEMDGNGAQFVKRLWIGLDLGKAISLKRYNRYRTFIKHDISNTEARLYPKNTAVIEKYALDTSTAYILTRYK